MNQIALYYNYLYPPSPSALRTIGAAGPPLVRPVALVFSAHLGEVAIAGLLSPPFPRSCPGSIPSVSIASDVTASATAAAIVAVSSICVVGAVSVVLCVSCFVVRWEGETAVVAADVEGAGSASLVGDSSVASFDCAEAAVVVVVPGRAAVSEALAVLVLCSVATTGPPPSPFFSPPPPPPSSPSPSPPVPVPSLPSAVISEGAPSTTPAAAPAFLLPLFPPLPRPRDRLAGGVSSCGGEVGGGAGDEGDASFILLASNSDLVTSSRLRVRRSAPARALRRRKMCWS